MDSQVEGQHEDPGSAGALVQRLRAAAAARDPVAQQAALDALRRLADGPGPERAAVAAAGGIQAAVACLCGSQLGIQERGADLLRCLAEDDAQRSAAIVAARGVPALARLMHSSDDGIFVAAASALRHLVHAGGAGACAAALEAGAVQPLVRQLRHSYADEVLHCAAATLSDMVCNSLGGPGAVAAVAAGAVPGVLRCLEASRGADTRGAAICALANLCCCSPQCCEQVEAAGGIPAVVRALAALEGHPQLADMCATLLGSLAWDSPGRCRAITAAGGAHALARCLDSPQWNAVKCGIAALARLDSRGQPLPAPGLMAATRLAGMLHSLTSSPLGADVQQAAAALMHRLRSGAFHGQGPEADGAEVDVRLLADAPPSAGPPTLATQPPRPPRVCAAPGCGATSGLRLCAGCTTVRYCSEACSRAHWREHRAECRRLRAERAAAAGGGGEDSTA